MEFVIVAILLILVLSALAYPLVGARRREVFAWGGAETLDDLLAQRDGLYASLRDLDQDLALGKLDTPDYQRLKSRYMTRAAETLARLDAIQAETHRTDDALNKSIESQVLAMRKTKSRGQATITPEAGREVAGYCRNCGTPFHAGDKFCGHCGEPVG
ncbi:MAG TPA: zinc ribbon domain-containing protein [Anaerolineae bacterium]